MARLGLLLMASMLAERGQAPAAAAIVPVPGQGTHVPGMRGQIAAQDAGHMELVMRWLASTKRRGAP
ncbi:MAG: hypothetical protein ACYDA6_03330 [Solirubrobacteraceae bacterium]